MGALRFRLSQAAEDQSLVSVSRCLFVLDYRWRLTILFVIVVTGLTCCYRVWGVRIQRALEKYHCEICRNFCIQSKPILNICVLEALAIDLPGSHIDEQSSKAAFEAGLSLNTINEAHENGELPSDSKLKYLIDDSVFQLGHLIFVGKKE